MLYLKKKKEKNLQISLFYSKNLYDMIYISWDVECNKLKLVIWVIFCAFNPQNQNQSFEKLKKASGDVIILQMCTKIHDHMMYASWDMECNMHNFLSLLAIFCPFTQLLTPKINIWKKCQKKNGRYYPSTDLLYKWRSYDVCFLRYNARQTVFCHFGSFFALWPS